MSNLNFSEQRSEFSAKTLSRHSGESRNPEDGRETLDCRVKPGNDEEQSDQNRLFAVDSGVFCSK
jgi:hypothetical protein